MELMPPDNPLAPFVSMNPEKLGGQPVFCGTRVPVRILFEYLEGGYTLDEFLEHFEGVTREQALGVLDVAAKRTIPPMAA